MASSPFIDRRRGTWHIKYKPDPAGPWVKANLGKHPVPFPASKPPKKAPQFVLDRAREFEEIEYRAKHGLGTVQSRENGLAGYVEDYLTAYRSSHAEASIEQAVRVGRLFVGFAAEKGVTSVQAVNKAICRDFLEWRLKSVNPNTLHNEKGYLSPIWTRAVDDELVQVNPWRQVKVPGKRTEHVPQFWSAEQVAGIAAACRKPLHADLVLVLANTGIRVSATLQMRWDWINWERGTIAVPKDYDKAGKGYSVAMARVAREVLERRMMTAKGEDLVFPNPLGRGILTYETFRDAFRRAVKRAGVPVGTPHDLRHTFARLLLASNAPINVVQATLGHASLAMTQRYTKIDERSAAPHLENFGVGQANPTPPPPPPAPGQAQAGS